VRSGVRFLGLWVVGISFLIACRAPLPLFPSASPEFLSFSSDLRQAYGSGDAHRVQGILDGWVRSHNPTPEEGELYASLITLFTFPLYLPSVLIARTFVERFPDHEQVWRGWAQLLLEALDQRKLSVAMEIWQTRLKGEQGIPYETLSALALRVARFLIAQGEITRGIELALEVPPKSPSPLFWQYLIRLAEGCCDPVTFPQNPLTPFFQLRTYLRRGTPPDLTLLKTQLLAEAKKLGLEPIWTASLFLLTSEIPPQPRWAYLLPRDPALFPLALRELSLLLCASPEGAEWRIIEGKRGVSSWLGSLLELESNARVVGFVSPDLILPFALLLALRGSHLILLNPLLTTSPLGNLTVLGISAREQGEELARALLRFPPRALALMLPDTPYGEEFLEAFSSIWLSEGRWFTAVIFYPPTEVDFTPYLDELTGRSVTAPREVWKDSPPPAQIDFDALVVVGPVPALKRIPSQLLYHDLVGVPVVGDISWQHPQILEAGSALEGIIFLGYLPREEERCIPPPFPPLPLDLVTLQGLQVLMAREPGVSWGSSRNYSLYRFVRKGVEPLKVGEPLPLFHPEMMTAPPQ